MSTPPTKKARIYSGRCVTFPESEMFHFTWTIRNFSEWIAHGENVRFSPLFPANVVKRQWELEFNCMSHTDPSFCSLFLKLKHSLDDHVKVSYDLAMMDANSMVLRTINGDHQMFKQGNGWGKNLCIKRDNLLERTQNDDTLIISCKINVTAPVVNEMIESIIVDPEPQSSLVEDLASLLESKKYGDVSIKVGNRKIVAHKNILAARSSVFAAMFEHMMQEKLTNVVNITDIKFNVLQEMLRYIYTDKVNNMDTLSYELFATADKYNIPALKALCRSAILANLSTENIPETLMCADLHSDDELKLQALDFLSNNSSVALGVTKSKGWKQMESTHSHLVTAAFEALARKI